jgi:NitT/TauT family transport system ATP-binding protein
VIRDLNVEIKSSEFTTILGPSGCGKSTLLKVMAELLPLDSGHLSFTEGHSPEKSMVFQEAQLLPWRTVRSNVALSLELRPRQEINVDEVLSLVGLGEVPEHYPDQLSGGMKMRVSLARALVGQPELMLMDEPFGALDEITRKLMGEEVLKFRSWCSSTIVLVTHSIEEAVFLSDRILVMPKTAADWVLDYRVDAPDKRDKDWKRSDHFVHQVNLLSDAIAKSMQSELIP